MSLHLSETKSYELPPAGTHPARCISVIDIGTQKTAYGEKGQVWLAWELLNELRSDGAPHVIGKRFTASLNKKAGLRAALDSWRGRPLSQEELKGFDLKNVLGKPCLVSVTREEKDDGKEIAVISSVVQAPKGMAIPPATTELIGFEIDSDNETVLEKVPEFLQKLVKESQEWTDRGKPPEPTATDRVARTLTARLYRRL